MAELYNVYIDESCHLLHDQIPVMVLGGVWCKASAVREISRTIADLKIRHDIPSYRELKWTKLSPSKQQLYLELIDYFFDEDELHFRGILIPDKSKLRHREWNQSHDTWYYKMLFLLLKPIINPVNTYAIYPDIKDTRSEEKRKKLEEVLRNAQYDPVGQVIQKVQQVRSDEVPLMQFTDVLIGAIGYLNRGLTENLAKMAVIERIRERSRTSLQRSTWPSEGKMNLLVWQAQEDNGVSS